MSGLKKTIFCFLIMMYGLGLQDAWAELTHQQAKDLVKKAYSGDSTALQTLQQAAEQNDGMAEEWLGVYFRSKNDYPDSFNWTQKAAAQGNPEAQGDLGYMYHDGLGVTKDDAQAIAWLQKAVNQDNAEAENSLGTLYASGSGVPKDYAKAISLFQKAAKNEYSLAPGNLGDMYYFGRGISKDYYQAFNWYQKGANLGDPYSEYALAYSYEKGQGVTQNDEEALLWYEKAANDGNIDAMKRLSDAYGGGELGLTVNLEKEGFWYTKAYEH